jgi:hypothetical protein
MLNATEFEHGCRSEYGPLELRIQTSVSLNEFTVYVEDSRLENTAVYEHPVQSTLESAKQSAVSRAQEYLNSRGETPQHEVKWRCS